MRTTEERAELIHRRVVQLRRERKRKRVEVLSVAACLLLVVAVGAWMPGLLSGMSTGTVETEVETASLLAVHPALGYIAMGILTFLLGVCVTVLIYRLREYKTDGEQEDEDEF